MAKRYFIAKIPNTDKLSTYEPITQVLEWSVYSLDSEDVNSINQQASFAERVTELDKETAFFGLRHFADIRTTIKVPANEKELLAELQFVQDRVFTASSQLATVDQARLPASFRPIGDVDIAQLEVFIDQLSEQLPVLTSFVIPGGNQANVAANLARVITRKTERLLVELMSQEQLPAVILQFLNRLSDWFFTVSRFVIHISQQNEVMWRAK